jgi:hypothetical protein
VKKYYQRHKQLATLPPRIVLKTTITSGRFGRQIKEIVQQKPDISIRDLESELRVVISPSISTPKKSTIANFFIDNKLVVVKLLRKPLISVQNKMKRLEFAHRFTPDEAAL